MNAILVLLPCALALSSCATATSRPARPDLFRTFGTAVPDKARHRRIPEGNTEMPADENWASQRKKMGLEAVEPGIAYGSGMLPGRSINRKLAEEAERFRASGYVPYVTDLADLVYRDSVPRPDQITSTISLQATPGEMETAGVAIHAFRALEGVRVTASDLKAQKGRGVITASEHIDVRSAFYMPRLGWRQPRYSVRPVILEKRSGVDADEGASQLFYVTVRVPEGTRPGDYACRLTISADHAAPREIDLGLTVLPFTLADPDVTYAFWYHADRTPPQFTEKDLVAMRGCGMNSIMLVLGDLGGLGMQHHNGIRVFSEDGAVRFDLSALEAFLTHYRDLGFSRPVIMNMVIKELLDLEEKDFAELVHRLNGLAKQVGTPGFIWSIGDENDAIPDSLPQTRRLLEWINRTVPDDLTKQTVVYPKNARIYGSALDLQIWAGYFDETVIEPTRQNGSTMGMYNGTGAYEVDARDNRFFYGVWTWAVGFGHIEQWVYNYAMYDHDEPFNDISIGARQAGRGNCHFYCYPGPDGPLPTVGYYGIMEGIDDIRYLRTAERHIAQARASGNEASIRAADAAAEALDAWRKRIDLSPPPTPMAYFVVSREAARFSLADYAALRRTAIECILEMRRVPGLR
ncbi:MAG: hypothetical protein CMJ18_07040 [Phycisphaeraceae bacterium]|nr:hypothetical protein [Phycisphaeraceae bacterium]